MSGPSRSSAEGAGPARTGAQPGTCEQALEQERAANRDLVRKCAELDEVISGSQRLVRELRREGDRLRRELAAAEAATRRADEAGRRADAELRRLRRELEEAAGALGRRRGGGADAPGKGSPPARRALREIRGRFARDYHPDLVTDPGEKAVRERVFKHVWTVFDELDAHL